MKNIFEFLTKKKSENNDKPDNVMTAEQYLQSAEGPTNEHKRAEIAGKARKETRTNSSGDRIEVLIAEDGSILEYLNKTDLTKIEQQRIQESMRNKQEQAQNERLSNN